MVGSSFYVSSTVCGGLCLVFVLLCILSVLSSFAITLKRKGELVVLLCLPDALCQIVFCSSFSRCRGLIYSL